MKKHILSILILLLALNFPFAQTKAADTVVIKVGDGSKVIFAIKDKKDLETLKRYDFQALMDDMIAKLEKKDTVNVTKPAATYLKDTVRRTNSEPEISSSSESTSNENWTSSRKHKSKRTYNTFNFDLGTNNYLSHGKFPDQDNSLYTVRPWGSWYVGMNSTYRTRVAHKFFIEWGFGVSWYNFKFQNNRVQMSKDGNGVNFAIDPRDLDYKKSKLTATYVNASFVPVIDFGDNKHKSSFFDNHGSDGFRFGVGPYVGYRIDSYSKQYFKENGDKNHERNHDNFYLNNVRYGLRGQFGFKDVDFFVNYDMNDLIATNKGPQLNAFSFGITF